MQRSKTWMKRGPRQVYPFSCHLPVAAVMLSPSCRRGECLRATDNSCHVDLYEADGNWKKHFVPVCFYLKPHLGPAPRHIPRSEPGQPFPFTKEKGFKIPSLHSHWTQYSLCGCLSRPGFFWFVACLSNFIQKQFILWTLVLICPHKCFYIKVYFSYTCCGAYFSSNLVNVRFLFQCFKKSKSYSRNVLVNLKLLRLS